MKKQPFYIKAEKKSGEKSSRYTTGRRSFGVVSCRFFGRIRTRPPGNRSLEGRRTGNPNPAYFFFSPSGYEIRKNYTGADYILYLPGDTRRNAVRLIEKFRPDAAVFIKYEFWFHYLNELNKRNIPVYLISAIFRPNQPFFFKSWGKLHRRMLGCFKELFVQDGQSVELLKSIGIKNVRLTGDTRFDRVKQIAEKCKTNRQSRAIL